jgi:hypothetical protein
MQIADIKFRNSNFEIVTLCPMLYTFSNLQSPILNPQSSIVFMFMPMLGVRPVLVCVCGLLVFMPVAVGDGFFHSRKRVIVVIVVVTMPVLMCNPLVMVAVGVFFEKQQSQRDSDNQRRSDLSGRNSFSEKNCSKDDPKKRGTRENDLTAGGAKFLGRSYIEHQAKTVRENTNQNGH